MRKVDGWQSLATKPIDQPIELAALYGIISFSEIIPFIIPTTFRAAPPQRPDPTVEDRWFRVGPQAAIVLVERVPGYA
jgi:hypothetical protein